jgi:hypothetical protein
MKLIDIVRSNDVLTKVSTQKVSGVLAYKLAVNTSRLQVHFEAYDKVRISLAEKYGELDKETNYYKITNPEEFNKELAVLLLEEVSLELKKLSMKDLESLELTPVEVSTILWMIDEG